MARIVFTIAALAAGGWFLTTNSTGAGQTKLPLPGDALPKDDVDPQMAKFTVCAKACDDCARACDMCSAHCAKMMADGMKEHHPTLRLCQDCAEICSATARIVARDGPLSGEIVEACADACKKCGDACEKHPDDPIMKKCADECRKCEKACRELLGKAKGGEPKSGEK